MTDRPVIASTDSPQWPRAAIYFSPAADSALHHFGSSWLGRDAFTAAACTQPSLAAIDADRLHTLTCSPRRYGFHATLRAPFHPADNTTIAQIIEHAESFARTQESFLLPLQVENYKGFMALTPRQASAALSTMEAALLAHFDPLVQPASEAERARRRKAGLSARQDAHLVRWGYPYVMDEFNFHMTLSERLNDAREAAILFNELRARTQEIIAAATEIDAIYVFVEAEKGAPFIAAARLPFRA